MSLCSLYIDSDGTFEGTHVCVLGEDGSLLGELDGVHHVSYQVDPVHGKAKARLELLKVSGRFLANDILIEEIGRRQKRPWWKR